ncbi:hypothetical protein B9Z55_011291 [Caenorhabditis nigoni]|uniref:Uncharacterized protein n=2 Tax=Caenorhabditis nigoni TaxID=1611254 RepID=A0A2G5UJZ7_9PELO|nr:hypothetical protein B9Z55_011291 [Caenorhabditis nigoni]
MSSSVPMIDLSSSGDDDDSDLMRSYLPVPGPPDDLDAPSLLFGNGNLCRSTLSINQISSMAPSPFSEITVSSQRPLVPRSGSNSSEHGGLMKEVKKKPVADIAHVSWLIVL